MLEEEHANPTTVPSLTDETSQNPQDILGPYRASFWWLLGLKLERLAREQTPSPKRGSPKSVRTPPPNKKR